MLDNIPQIANNVQSGTQIFQESLQIYNERLLFGSLLKDIYHLIYVDLANLLRLRVSHGCTPLICKGAYFSQPVNGFV